MEFLPWNFQRGVPDEEYRRKLWSARPTRMFLESWSRVTWS
jgi:hypothetical protein